MTADPTALCASLLIAEIATERGLGLMLELGRDAAGVIVEAIALDRASVPAAVLHLVLVAIRDRTLWMIWVRSSSEHSSVQHLKPPRIERRQALLLLVGERGGAHDVARMPIAEITFE